MKTTRETTGMVHIHIIFLFFLLLLLLLLLLIIIITWNKSKTTRSSIYLSTPPIREHKSALSTSGNMSNLRSARYTVVDLLVKQISESFPLFLIGWQTGATFFKPITKRSNRNHVIAFDSHLKTALPIEDILHVLEMWRKRFIHYISHRTFLVPVYNNLRTRKRLEDKPKSCFQVCKWTGFNKVRHVCYMNSELHLAILQPPTRYMKEWHQRD